MKLSKLFTVSKEASSSSAMAQSSKKETPLCTSPPLAFGTLLQMGPSL